MLGIDNLKKLLDAGLKLGQHVANDLSDKKISLLEGIGLIPDLFSVVGVIKSWDDIKAELSDLTPEETQQLEGYAMNEFNIPNERVKTFVQHALTQVVSLVSLVQEFKDLKNPPATVTTPDA